MYKRIIILGENDAAHYAEGGIEQLKEHREELSGQIIEREFETIAECSAYIMGINDMMGHDTGINVGFDDFEEVKKIYNSPTGKAW